jgi:hypothetical protein
MLDPDPYQMTTDPKHWQEVGGRKRKTTRFVVIRFAQNISSTARLGIDDTQG